MQEIEDSDGMAKYRNIYQKIWKEPDFQEYSPEKKLIFIYLFSNQSTTESGIYQITVKTISGETGVSLETVSKLLGNGYKNIVYDPDTCYVYVRKFRRYNGGGRPDLIQKTIASEYETSCDTGLWSLFLEDYPEYTENIMSIKAPILYTNTKSNTKAKSKDRLLNLLPTVDQPLEPTKKTYGQFSNILLSDDEVSKLKTKFGEADAMQRIEAISESFQAHTNYQKKYKNHYATILSWARLDEKRGNGNGRNQGHTQKSQPGNRPAGAFDGIG